MILSVLTIIMRIRCYRPQKILLIFAVVTNVLTLVYLGYLQDQLYTSQDVSHVNCLNRTVPNSVVHIQHDHDVTIIIREFEDFENDVPKVVSSIVDNFGDSAAVLIVSDRLPYPPLQVKESPTVRTLILATDVESSYENSLLTKWISSEFVLLVPDGVQLVSGFKNQVVQSLQTWSKNKARDNVRLIAWPVDKPESVQCLGLNVKLKEWTIQYYSSSEFCDALGGGPFVLGIKRQHYLQLASPLARPLQESIFIQTTINGWKVIIDKTPMWSSRVKLHTELHSAWKQKSLHRERVRNVYKDFGIKLVHRLDGTEEQFGCSKTSERCFATVHKEMPDYLYQGRWTPPCCLNALRITARHVFRILEQQNVRYWLEGGTLLGAARNGDIIPWDYDVDIGIYKEDIHKSTQLANCLKDSVEDEDGFVWEKATEGDFIRVQYSASNHLHVDIFPFYPVNGTMTKSTWFATHRQDMPFPEHFLKPLEKINFVGASVFVPNNWKKFIDLKFGIGAIDNPKYPDSSVAKYN